MSRCCIIAAGLSMLCFNTMTLGVCSAQSFEERWSPVPKAHAEPNPPPQQDRQPASEPRAKHSRASRQQAGSSTNTARAPTGRAQNRPTRRAQNHRGFSGRASFYAYRGRKTASGAAFNRNGLTAAHRTLPFGTRLRVTNVSTGKSVHVIITDRGPAARSRVLDLSEGAARALQVGNRGIIQVHAEMVGKPGAAMR
jgi:peptidoglycan lytic transglycosylase